MKLCFALLSLIISAEASANCISKSEAKIIAKNYLITQGEVQFPFVFAGRTPAQIEANAESVIHGLYTDEYDSEILGYSAWVYGEGNQYRQYDEYLVVSCNGNTHKRINHFED